MLEALTQPAKETKMKGSKVNCPVCGNDAYVSKHQTLSPSTGHSVPCYIYTCEKDGWYKLSESVNEVVMTNRTSEIAGKLSAKVAANYFPESLIPMESITPLTLIESLE